MKILKIGYKEKTFYVLTNFITYLKLKRNFKGTKIKIKKLNYLAFNAGKVVIDDTKRKS
jgi:hypothetical protein